MKQNSFTAEISTKEYVVIDIQVAARWFAHLSDDEQSRFFVAVAAEMSAWKIGHGHTGQGYYIGSHLRNCECSTDAAREFVQAIHEGMTRGAH